MPYLITLRGPQGNVETLRVGEEARNLPQVRVGDRVVVEYLPGAGHGTDCERQRHPQTGRYVYTDRALPPTQRMT